MYGGFSAALTELGIEGACDRAVEMGFGFVEGFASTAPDAVNAIPDVKTAAELKTALEKRGLYVACHSVFANVWGNPDAEEALKRQVDIAAAMGSPYFHHTMLPWLTVTEAEPSFEEGIERAVEVAAAVADYAAPLGIRCIYEDQGHYVNGVKGFGIFYSEMKKRCSNVGVCGDFGNILFEDERPEVFFAAFAEDICHIHVKDYLRKEDAVSPGRFWLSAKEDIWLRDTMVGSGIIDFKACMDVLKKVGYNGVFALEVGGPEPFEDNVYQAMEYCQRFW